MSSSEEAKSGWFWSGTHWISSLGVRDFREEEFGFDSVKSKLNLILVCLFSRPLALLVRTEEDDIRSGRNQPCLYLVWEDKTSNDAASCRKRLLFLFLFFFKFSLNFPGEESETVAF